VKTVAGPSADSPASSRPIMKQLSLEFEKSLRGHLPPDETVLCSECRRVIVTQHWIPGGVSSEYRDAQGRCFECNINVRKIGR
jgi:hypothetical protein